MLRVGLTGGIASGKSTVGEFFLELGAWLLDADQLARDVVAPGTEGLAAVVERFGTGVLRPDGSLDRPALGRIVFSDGAARTDLEAIVHPLVRARGEELEQTIEDPYAIVVHMVPLLVETGRLEHYDEIVVVDVDEATQLRRLVERDGLSETDALARIAAQADRTERLRAADYIIRNDAGLPELRERTHAVWHDLLAVRAGQRSCC